MIIQPEIMITKNLHPEDVKILEESERSEKIIFKQKSSFNGEIWVVETGFGRFLKFENSCQSGLINHPSYKGNIPYVNYFFLAAAMKRTLKKVLILGLGSGNFVNRLESILPDVEKIDVVEINPEIVDIAAKYFGYKQSLITEIKFQDARVFVRNCSEQYDLIILDVFSQTGMEYRFMTKEFLEGLNKILSPEGVLASNIFGLTDINSQNNIIFKASFKTYSSVFKDNIIFPAGYADYVFYKQLIGLKHDLSDLTNVIVFSSRKEIEIKTSKVLNIMDELKIDLDIYVQDFYLDDINLENIKLFLDIYENNPGLSPEKIKNFLRTI